MKIGLETFSYYLWFADGKMDVFSFIDRTRELGLDGVQLNLEGENFGHLGGADPAHLAAIKAKCDELGFFIDVDVAGTDPDYLLKGLEICQALGADRMRTYSSFGGDVKEELAKALKDFKEVAPAFEEAGVGIAFENHEFESSHDIMRIIDETASPIMGAHIDTGNSMMLWEDPIQAIRNMAPKALSTHVKDHLVIEFEGGHVVVGVPLGAGTIDLAECYRIFEEETELDRINIEVCYGYLAPFRMSREEGLSAELGRGAFAVAGPPFAPEVIAPHLLRPKEGGFKSYAWQEMVGLIRDDERDQLRAWQNDVVEASVKHMLDIRRNYQAGEA